MIHLYQTFPTPPSDLSQFFNWFAAPETLFAFFLLYLKIPAIAQWPDWKKGAVYVAVASVATGLVIALSMVLSPDLIAKAQPFYAPFVVILNLVLGYYGFQAIRKPIKYWFTLTMDIWWAKTAADVANRTGREPNEEKLRTFLAPRRG